MSHLAIVIAISGIGFTIALCTNNIASKLDASTAAINAAASACVEKR